MIYVLDNQYIDKAALNKSLILADKGESVLYGLKNLKSLKTLMIYVC